MMTKQEKTFDAVAWMRARRDELYQKYGHLSTAEFLQQLAEEARQSKFGQQLAEKFGKVQTPEELLGPREQAEKP